ncbi:unnamed protein product [marine sediment metagenome]|uniref:Uncharacterized protein n=1 Tax=marine sediment metagenome TaxID=412755 RepID=X1VWK7_9ZZZZ
MKTREEIEIQHDTNSHNIRASYHDKQEISHEEYHSQLNAENERYEVELIAEGFLEPPPGSTEARNLRVEIDAIKTKIADYDNLKTRVETLEKK